MPKPFFSGEFHDLAEHHCALHTGILGDLHARLAEALHKYGRPGPLVLVVERIEYLVRELVLDVSKAGATSGDDSELARALYRVKRILIPELLILEFRLRGGSHLDPGDAAPERGHALLRLIPVEVRVGLLALPPDLSYSGLHGFLLLPVRDDGGELLGDDAPVGRPEHVCRDRVEGDADLLGDIRGAGGDGDVLEVGLPALSESRGADGHHVEHASHLVDDEGREGVARDVLGDHEDGLLRLDELLEEGHDLVDVVDLGVGDEDARVH
mmetsp:Transcript_6526/g.13820  ORF Transcript_6526/g.13820 Transcript_6526/m.13820 type:complete len:269 (+) Transcript_6526:134-940(+)